MKINELCKLTGLKSSTVRVYEEHGLIHPATEERNGKLWRDYSELDVQRLEIIAALRKALFSLEQISVMLDNPSTIPPIVQGHSERVGEMTQSMSKLYAALLELDMSSNISAGSLARQLTEAISEFPLPKADTNPHFRHLDAIEEASKRKVIKKRKVKLFTPVYFIILFIMLLISTVIAVNSVNSKWVSLFNSVYNYKETVYDQNGKVQSKIFTGYYENNLTVAYESSETLSWKTQKLLEDCYLGGYKYLLSDEMDEFYINAITLTFDNPSYSHGIAEIIPKDNPERDVYICIWVYNDRSDYYIPPAVKLSLDVYRPGYFNLKTENRNENEMIRAIKRIDKIEKPYFGLLPGIARTICIIIGVFTIIWVGFRRLLAPSIDDLSSSDSKERMLAYGTMTAAGAYNASMKHTIGQVTSSPMEASIAIKRDE